MHMRPHECECVCVSVCVRAPVNVCVFWTCVNVFVCMGLYACVSLMCFFCLRIFV